ncbi:hypothetical protein [Sphingomonas solaris]|uniref:PRC-barrel domain containing protein n=1 Tax=Alterirhizorhabdus solaris TaxID=2529389 RepID=A0A558R670_9SPHN|nr:hypothetical protein [Sphingomonas solaris]TVV74880.1 hypothetical protein FOY91_08575 [Sphingomonas solaris]
MRRMTIVAVGTLAALTPVAAQAQGAGLGLTVEQLEDAGLVDAAGNDIGDVEHAVIGPDGKAPALIVELDRPDPQREKLVRIGLAGLKAVP